AQQFGCRAAGCPAVTERERMTFWNDAFREAVDDHRGGKCFGELSKFVRAVESRGTCADDDPCRMVEPLGRSSDRDLVDRRRQWRWRIEARRVRGEGGVGDFHHCSAWARVAE